MSKLHTIGIDRRSLLITRREQFTRPPTENLLTYALGRETAFTDRRGAQRVLW